MNGLSFVLLYIVTAVFIVCFRKKRRERQKVLKAVRWVLTKRERRKAGEDMETVSCKRKMMHIRAVTQKCIESLKKKQINVKKDATQFI